MVHLDRRRRHLQLLRLGRAADREASREAGLVPLQRVGPAAIPTRSKGPLRLRSAKSWNRPRNPRARASRTRRPRRCAAARLRRPVPNSTEESPMPFSVPDLPYAYDALEPHIDEATMRVHHDKHHQAYVDKANAALEGTEWADRDVEDVLRNLVQPARRQAGPGPQQRRRPLQPLALLADAQPRRRRRARGRPRHGDHRDLRLLRRLQRRVQKRRHRPLRLRLGLAGQRLLRPRRRLDAEPGLARLRRQRRPARLRRLGARLLPQVPEQTARIHRRLLERRQLGLRGGAASLPPKRFGRRPSPPRGLRPAVCPPSRARRAR